MKQNNVAEYYKSINLQINAKSDDEDNVYCDQILTFIKRNIHMNFHTDQQSSAFFENCIKIDLDF